MRITVATTTLRSLTNNRSLCCPLPLPIVNARNFAVFIARVKPAAQGAARDMSIPLRKRNFVNAPILRALWCDIHMPKEGGLQERTCISFPLPG